MFLFKKKFFFILFIFIINCSSSLNKYYNRNSHIGNIEKLYLNKEFNKAISLLRKRVASNYFKDRLLYLMEVGSIFHSINQWEKSNLSLLEAEEIADSTYKSISENIKGYFLNEREKKYNPEIFERILIKLYIALNYLFLNEKEKALKYLQKISVEQRDIRDSKINYQQNLMARYLYAIVAESMGQFNQARVQYKNLLLGRFNEKEIKSNLLYLAIKERDYEDIKNYRNYPLVFYDNYLNQIKLTNSINTNGLGELVIIFEYGLGPYKQSRGKIGRDPNFSSFLNTSFILSLLTKEQIIDEINILLWLIKNSENPIPYYKKRRNYSHKYNYKFKINNLSFLTTTVNDYERIVIKNFNENYPQYVKKNINTILSKILTSLISSKIISQNTNNKNLGFLINLIAGSLIATNIKPDLRSWALTYKNIQIKRIFLLPGKYKISHQEIKNNFNYLSPLEKEIEIKKNLTTFIKVRAF